jgi:uncharacterized protein YbaA (DUF1428 family)
VCQVRATDTDLATLEAASRNRTRWTSVRKVKEGETTNDLYAFLTTEPNKEVGAIHPKAMPAILTTPEEIETWMTALIADALKRTSFPRTVKAKDNETVVFSWIIYKSRAHRNAVVKRAMADPRMKMDMSKMPFDGKRMIYGGFKTFLAMQRFVNGLGRSAA